MRKSFIVSLLAVCILFFLPSVGDAFQNVCKVCNTQAELTDVRCKQCGNPLNKCLSCGTENEVQADFCVKCKEPLAEMRLLGTIDNDVREDLRLGDSTRARLERELKTIEHLLTTNPEKTEAYMYRRAKVFQQMNFSSREADAWQAFLDKFPESQKAGNAKAYLSEALRKWGYLFHQQGNKDAALGKFLEACQANPMNAEALTWTARTYYEKNMKKESGDYYLKVLEARPGDKTATHFLKIMKRPIPGGK